MAKTLRSKQAPEKVDFCEPSYRLQLLIGRIMWRIVKEGSSRFVCRWDWVGVDPSLAVVRKWTEMKMQCTAVALCCDCPIPTGHCSTPGQHEAWGGRWPAETQSDPCGAHKIGTGTHSPAKQTIITRTSSSVNPNYVHHRWLLSPGLLDWFVREGGGGGGGGGQYGEEKSDGFKFPFSNRIGCVSWCQGMKWRNGLLGHNQQQSKSSGRRTD